MNRSTHRAVMQPSDQPFQLGDGLRRAAQIRAYQRRRSEPLSRSLWIYSTDPADSKLDGSRVILQVPFETLQPGPSGHLFEVIPQDDSGSLVDPVDLNAPPIAVASGLPPSTDFRFQAQMTYAVAMGTYDAFRQALGRFPHWGFDTPAGQPARLRIYPTAKREKNAFYRRTAKAVHFGFYDSSDKQAATGLDGRIRPVSLRPGRVYTSLSHDVVTHEISHALLDGLKPGWLKPMHAESLALHEGFSDLVAVFRHFSHRPLLREAIRRSRGNLRASRLLTDLARQFGQTLDQPLAALRTAVDYDQHPPGQHSHNGTSGGKPESGVGPAGNRQPVPFDETLQIHQLGAVLLSAVFEAFATIYERKTRRYIKIATEGRGVLPPGEIQTSLADVLADQAAKLARQILTMCIRAVDYCPPVAVTFADYLRGLITADHDLVPDDPHGYREALIDAFARRRIDVPGVTSLDESSLVWQPLKWSLPVTLIQALQRECFGRNDEDTIARPDKSHYVRRARHIGRYLIQHSHRWKQIGLVAPGDVVDQAHRSFSVPTIESARFSHRVGPDGQLEQELVIEVTQRVESYHANQGAVPLVQGCTLIVEANGSLRHVISRTVGDYEDRLRESLGHSSLPLRQFWEVGDEGWSPVREPVSKIHQ